MTSPAPAPAVVFLAEAAKLIADRDARWDGGPILHGDDTDAFNAAQDAIAARVPALTAALEAVLAVHQFKPAASSGRGHCSTCLRPGGFTGVTAARWPCATYEAIETALRDTQGGAG